MAGPFDPVILEPAAAGPVVVHDQPAAAAHVDQLADVQTLPAATGRGWFATRTALVNLLVRAANNGWQAAGPLLLPLLLLQSPWTGRVVLAALVAFGTSAVVSAAKSWLTWKVFPVPPLSFWPNTAVSAATAFVGALAGYVAQDQAFDLLTFHWSAALPAAGGAAVLALVKEFVAAADKGGISSYSAVRANLRRAAASEPPTAA